MKRAMILVLALLGAAWAASDAIDNRQSTIADGPDAVTIPRLLSYQGKLTDTNGNAVPDTTYSVAFRLYTVPSGGTQFWTETQTVRTESGLFSVLLGSVTPIGSMPDAGAVYLGMAVAGGAELTPRLRIASAAYAYLTERAANSDLLQGRDTTTFSRSTHNHDAAYVNEGQADAVTGGMIVNGAVVEAEIANAAVTTSKLADTAVTMAKLARAGASTGQVVKWTGTSWAPGPDNTGGGTGVTNVYQDTGITCVPNPITTTGNVKLNLTYVDGRYLNEGQAAGGDLAGTYPNPTITANAVGSAEVTDNSLRGADIAKPCTLAATVSPGAVLVVNNSGGGDALQAQGVIRVTGQIVSSVADRQTDADALPDGDEVSAGQDLAPIVVTSTTTCPNLSADLLDGYSAAATGNNVIPYTDGTGKLNVSVIPGMSYADSARVAANSYKLQGKDTTGFVRTGQANSITSAMITDATVAAADLNQMGASTGQVLKWTGSAWAPRADSLGTGDNAWVRGGDSVLYTVRQLGIARGGAGNALLGTTPYTHANFGVSCTTGTLGGPYSYSAVGGGTGNAATGSLATVAGGSGNRARRVGAAVGGGQDNSVTGDYGAIGGGSANAAVGERATVSGGSGDTARAAYGAVGGGYSNLAGDAADDTSAVIAGGWDNTATGKFTFVGGGRKNIVNGSSSVVCGGDSNVVGNWGTTIGGGLRNSAPGLLAVIGGGSANWATGTYSAVTGGYTNFAGGYYAGVGTGHANIAGNVPDDTAAVVAGGRFNYAQSRYAAIGGGRSNRADATCATVCGGDTNVAHAGYGAVGGGYSNLAGDAADDTSAAIAGGWNNSATGKFAAVGGGRDNSASGRSSVVAGGDSSNTSGGDWGAIGGGCGNEVEGSHGAVAGGYHNRAGVAYGAIAGGYGNYTSGTYAAIGGGLNNTADGVSSVIAGGQYNNAQGTSSTVAGGQWNSTAANCASVGGGYDNVGMGYASTIAGGDLDSVVADWGAALSGCSNKAGDAAADTATVVAGGWDNTATGKFNTIGGGYQNNASNNYATIAGGRANTVNGPQATVGGGWGNVASGWHSVVAGGFSNSASGTSATVVGGEQNTASGYWATAAGGGYNAARGYYSLAAGRYARANHNGSFAWSDSAVTAAESVYTTGSNQFRVRARSGTWFYSNAGMTTGAYLAPGSNAWASACDSSTKEDFREVDRQELLQRVAALRVRNYKMCDQDDGTRHIGPVAQDFAAAFGVGESNTSINMADADGVLLAAVQALYEQNTELARSSEQMKAEIEALKAALAAKR